MRPAELVQCIECRGDEYFTWIFSFFFTCTSLPPSLVFCLLVQVACLKPFEECSLLGRSASLVLIPGLLSTYWARTDERLDLPSTRVGLTWQYFVSESYPSPQYIYICWIKRVFCLKIVENQVYLWYGYCLNLFGKLRGEANFGNTIAKILWKKVRERREIWCDRRGREKKGISAMVLPNYVPKKSGLTYLKLGTNLTEIKKKKKKNCGNWIVNCGKSNALSTNYFIIFLQIVVIANFLLVLIKAHQ